MLELFGVLLRAVKTSPDRCLLAVGVGDQGESLLKQVIALAELVDGIVDQVSGDIIKAMAKVVELFGVMAVVVEHILQKCQSFFR